MTPSATYDKPLRSFLRTPPVVGREERIGIVTELLRVSPYGCVPVLAGGRLLGLVTEATLARFLLDLPVSGEERRHALELRVERVLEPVPVVARPEWTVGLFLQTLDARGTDALPVTDGEGNYLGMVGRADLVRELLRPLALPTLGGMATPLGVYLSTGSVSAGASHLALVLTGVCFFVVQVCLLLLLSVLETYLPPLPVPGPLRETLELFFTTTVTLLGFLGAVRLSPVAGYHAAEHQVVHAIERHAPLLPDVVRHMPRVHPRCGTNLASAMFLLGAGSCLVPLIGKSAYVVALLLALTYWRSLGAWFQDRLTTRPATPAQLAQGIEAAKTLLARHEAAAPGTPTPLKRLWYSGLPQVLLGFGLGMALVALLAALIPPLGAVVRPHWNELLEL